DVIGGVITGLTSLVNMSGAFFALAGYLLFVERHRPRGLVVLTALLFVLAALRSYLWSERLALLEAVIALSVPAVMGLLAHRPGAVAFGGNGPGRQHGLVPVALRGPGVQPAVQLPLGDLRPRHRGRHRVLLRHRAAGRRPVRALRAA